MHLCKNINIIMEIVLMNDDAIIPTRASKISAGLDLYSSIDVNIDTNSIKKLILEYVCLFQKILMGLLEINLL